MEYNRNFAIYTASFILFTLAAITTSIWVAGLSPGPSDCGWPEYNDCTIKA